MNKIRKSLKVTFPRLFEEYKHLQRRRIIFEINKRKKLPQSKYREVVDKMYKKRIGEKIKWDNLTLYTEKMQWDKLYNKNPLKTLYADKFAVREWITNTIGSEYLIPLLGVWEEFDAIDFSKLPQKFVLKTNHGSGTNIIVTNKSDLNINMARQKFKDWMAIDFGYKTMELHYSGIMRKIIAEQYVETKFGELQDYKFLCFDGVPYYCWVDMGRYSNHTRNVYDMNWVLQSWNQETYLNYKDKIEKPKNFELMVSIVKKLSAGFPHVRVDLYNVEGKIYFGEITFSNGGGFDRILPHIYNEKLGELWRLPITQQEEKVND